MSQVNTWNHLIRCKAWLLAAALLIVAAPVNESEAQQSTVGDQLNYFGSDPLESYRNWASLESSASSIASGQIGPSVNGQVPTIYAPIDNFDSSSLIFTTILGPDGSIAAVLTSIQAPHTFNIAFDTGSIGRYGGFRTWDAGGVYWIYDEDGVRPDPNRVAANQTQISLNNLQSDSSQIARGTDSKTVFITVRSQSMFSPQYSKFAPNRHGGGVGLTYGYYEYVLFDRFRIDAEGGILGRASSDTRVNNLVTGPQAGIVAYKTIGSISLYGHAMAVAGLDDADMRQDNTIGAELVPGAINRLLYAQPTYSEHSFAFNRVSPTGVLWAEAGLHITEQTTLRFAWSAVYANNILLAQDRVRYYLPDMGFRDPGDQHYVQQLFFCGIEMVH